MSTRLITKTPGVCGGLPCIRGTRLTVASILDRLAVHGDIKTVVAYYNREDVQVKHIKAVLSYASDVLNSLRAAGEDE